MSKLHFYQSRNINTCNSSRLAHVTKPIDQTVLIHLSYYLLSSRVYLLDKYIYLNMNLYNIILRKQSLFKINFPNHLLPMKEHSRQNFLGKYQQKCWKNIFLERTVLTMSISFAWRLTNGKKFLCISGPLDHLVEACPFPSLPFNYHIQQ